MTRVKKVFTSVIAAVLGVALASTPAFALPSTNTWGGGRQTACQKRLVLINGFAEDLERFKSNHYILPNLATANTSEITDLNGKKYKVATTLQTVTVYVNGQPKQVKRANYAIPLQRHEGALGTLKAKPSVNLTDYSNSINAFKSSIESAKGEITTIGQSWSVAKGNASCANKEEGKKVQDLTKKRSAHLKQMSKTRGTVKKASGKASAEYKKAAKAYKKAS